MTLAGALLLAVLAAEPGALPSGLHAVPVQEGTAVVIVNGQPTYVRLVSGWYFDAEGYERLSKVTADLQSSVNALEASAEVLRAPCPAVQPAPVVVQQQAGWSTKTLLVVGLVAGLLGAGAAVALR